MDFEGASFNLTKENQLGATDDTVSSLPKDEYQTMLASSMQVGNDSGRILAFKHKAPAAPEGYDNSLRGLYNQNLGPAPAKKQSRHIPTTMERILDAPDLVDDYYLNLLDWSCNNVVRPRGQGRRLLLMRALKAACARGHALPAAPL